MSQFLLQLYDSSDFKFLASVPSPPSHPWLGGDFVAADCVLVWSTVSMTGFAGEERVVELHIVGQTNSKKGWSQVKEEGVLHL